MISHSPGWGLSLWPHSAWLSRTAPEHTDMPFPNIWASFEQVTNVTMIGMELPKYNNVKITLTRTPSLHWGKIHQFSLSSYLCPIASMSWRSQLLLLSCNGSKSPIIFPNVPWEHWSVINLKFMVQSETEIFDLISPWNVFSSLDGLVQVEKEDTRGSWYMVYYPLKILECFGDCPAIGIHLMNDKGFYTVALFLFPCCKLCIFLN